MFTDIGDANPINCNAKVAKHLIRMASTRAKARALRDLCAIGYDMLGRNFRFFRMSSGMRRTNRSRKTMSESSPDRRKKHSPSNGDGKKTETSETKESAGVNADQETKTPAKDTQDNKKDFKSSETKTDKGNGKSKESKIPNDVWCTKKMQSIIFLEEEGYPLRTWTVWS